MFNSSQKNYKISQPEITKDQYNQEIVEYKEKGTAKMFIGLNDYDHYAQNATYITQCEYAAVTSSQLPQVNDLIDDKYIVEYIVEAGRDRFLYLKELDSGYRR